MGISFTKNDFKIEWYSGSGAGGQHRNKHQNCCRITHLDSGFVERGTGSKSRVSNQKEAFIKLANRVVKWIMENNKEDKDINTETIRTYAEYRNIVHDTASGLKLPYKDIVINGNIGPMIDGRRKSKGGL